MKTIKYTITSIVVLICLSSCANNGNAKTQVYGEITGGVEHTHTKSK
ncbi:MAG: hypothetical protein IKI22_05805 [Neisseriaceae bacterium]|nr:hypothetical protein [Neisseriaceae bacterium]